MSAELRFSSLLSDGVPYFISSKKDGKQSMRTLDDLAMVFASDSLMVNPKAVEVDPASIEGLQYFQDCNEVYSKYTEALSMAQTEAPQTCSLIKSLGKSRDEPSSRKQPVPLASA